MADLRIAVVCSSNQNRSMEAHSFLGEYKRVILVQDDHKFHQKFQNVHPTIGKGPQCKNYTQLYNISLCQNRRRRKKGFKVRSFGTGNQVKLPGPSPNQPNIYDFNTSYDEMYKDLLRKDAELYIDVIKVRGLLGSFANVQYTQNGILHMLDRNRRIKPKPERFQACKDIFDVIITCEERVYDQLLEDLETREKVENHPVHVINIDIQDNHEEATIGAFLICDLVTMLTECEDMDDEVDEILQEFEHKCQRTILHTVCFY